MIVLLVSLILCWFNFGNYLKVNYVFPDKIQALVAVTVCTCEIQPSLEMEGGGKYLRHTDLFYLSDFIFF